MKKIILYSLAITLVLASHASAQSPRDFATQAASFSHFEVEASTLAEQKAQYEATKLFARDSLRAHRMSLRDLEDATQKDGLTLPTSLDAEHMQKLDALKETQPAEFDQAYLSTQVSVHEEARTRFQAFIDSGVSGSLLSYAENRLGTVRTFAIRVQGLTSD